MIGQSASFTPYGNYAIILLGGGIMARPQLKKSIKVTKEDLERYYNEGMTLQEIGDIYGCDRKNIDYYFKKFGIVKRDRKEYMRKKEAEKRGTDIDLEEIKKMIDDGMLIDDICSHYNVGRSTIYKRTKEAGLNFRNNKNQRKRQSEFMKANNPVPKNSKRGRESMLPAFEARRNTFLKKLLQPNLSYKQYAKHARHIAYTYYKNNGLYDASKEIDHIYSVKDGYDNNVPILLISHPNNLRQISQAENRGKQSNSLVTLEEFYIGVGVQRLSVKE